MLFCKHSRKLRLPPSMIPAYAAPQAPRDTSSEVWDNAAIVKTFDAALRNYSASGSSPADNASDVPWMHQPLTVDGKPDPPPVSATSAPPTTSSFTAAKDSPTAGRVTPGEGAYGEEQGELPPMHGFPSVGKALPTASEGDEALTQMLLAWYNAGYQTGRYQALREMQDAKGNE